MRYTSGMGKSPKSTAGRKPLPGNKRKKQVAFRAELPVIESLKRVAAKNGRNPSLEILFAMKKYLRENGEVIE